MGDPVRDRPGLAGAGAGQDADRPVQCFGDRALLGVEAREDVVSGHGHPGILAGGYDERVGQLRRGALTCPAHDSGMSSAALGSARARTTGQEPAHPRLRQRTRVGRRHRHPRQDQTERQGERATPDRQRSEERQQHGDGADEHPDQVAPLPRRDVVVAAAPRFRDEMHGRLAPARHGSHRTASAG